jgi:hypothetical protein
MKIHCPKCGKLVANIISGHVRRGIVCMCSDCWKEFVCTEKDLPDLMKLLFAKGNKI